MGKTLGLDLGIASVGWCLYESKEIPQGANKDGVVSFAYIPERIIDLGSFVFDEIENKKDGTTENQTRREKRLMRRQRRRKVRRLSDLRDLFSKQFGADFLKDVIGKKAVQASPFEIKVKGLKEKLSPEELMVALYHYMKWRGFKSNRKAADAATDDKSEKKMLSGISALRKELSDLSASGTKTYVTQYLLDDFHKRINTSDNTLHNSDAAYHLTVDRDTYLEEINALLDKQIELGVVDSEFKEKFLAIYLRQRSYSLGPDKHSPYAIDPEENLGTCQFDGKKRAPKDSMTAKRFVVLSKLVNLQYRVLSSGSSEYLSLTPDQIKKLEPVCLTNNDVKYSKLLKEIGLDAKDTQIKGLSLSRKEWANGLKKFKQGKNIPQGDDIPSDLKDEFAESLRKALFQKSFFSIKGSMIEKVNSSLDVSKLTDEDKSFVKTDDFYDELSEVLIRYKDDVQIKDALSKAEPKQFSDDLIGLILSINIDAKSPINLSLDICKKLIPLLREGLTYDKAMAEVGYAHVGSNSRSPISNEAIPHIPPINEALKEMGVALLNPVVKHTLVQMRKIVNAVNDKYGRVDDYVVELSRELRKSFDERNQIRFEQMDSQRENLELKNELIEQFPDKFRSYYNVNKDAILRLKLYKEQGGISPYTGKPIHYRDMFDQEYQIDHIMPYSRSFDDSFNNKVLVEAKANQEKGNRLPYEVGGELFKSITAFLSSRKYYNGKKRDNLLRKEIPEDFHNRDFTDSAYIATLAKRIITYFMLPPERQCRSTSGGVTSALRKAWGLSGKTHTYYKFSTSEFVSYENNAYQAKFLTDYRFKSIEIGKSIVFTLSNPTYESGYEKTFEIKAPAKPKKKSKEDESDEQDTNKMSIAIKYFQNHSSVVLNRFLQCVGMPMRNMQESFTGERIDAINGSESELRDNAMTIFAALQVMVQQDIDEKNRSNDLHHALDAAIIGAVNPSLIKRISEANRDGANGKIQYPLPYPDFKSEVLARVYERDGDKLLKILNGLSIYRDHPLTKYDVHVLIPVRQPKHDKSGPLSKETIMGADMERGLLTKKASVFDVLKILRKEKTIEERTKEAYSLIVDASGGNKAVTESILDWCEKIDKGEAEETQYPVLPQKGTFIKKVRIYDAAIKTAVKLSSENNSYAARSDVIRVDVYKKKNGNDALYFVPIFRYQLCSNSEDQLYTIFWKQGSDGSDVLSKRSLNENYILIASLPRYSLIEIELRDGHRFLSYSGGGSSGFFEIYSIIGDSTDVSILSGRKMTERWLITVSTIKTIKVRSVSVLGKAS